MLSKSIHITESALSPPKSPEVAGVLRLSSQRTTPSASSLNASYRSQRAAGNHGGGSSSNRNNNNNNNNNNIKSNTNTNTNTSTNNNTPGHNTSSTLSPATSSLNPRMTNATLCSSPPTTGEDTDYLSVFPQPSLSTACTRCGASPGGMDSYLSATDSRSSAEWHRRQNNSYHNHQLTESPVGANTGMPLHACMTGSFFTTFGPVPRTVMTGDADAAHEHEHGVAPVARSKEGSCDHATSTTTNTITDTNTTTPPTVTTTAEFNQGDCCRVRKDDVVSPRRRSSNMVVMEDELVIGSGYQTPPPPLPVFEATPSPSPSPLQRRRTLTLLHQNQTNPWMRSGPDEEGAHNNNSSSTHQHPHSHQHHNHNAEDGKKRKNSTVTAPIPILSLEDEDVLSSYLFPGSSTETMTLAARAHSNLHSTMTRPSSTRRVSRVTTGSDMAIATATTGGGAHPSWARRRSTATRQQQQQPGEDEDSEASFTLESLVANQRNHSFTAEDSKEALFASSAPSPGVRRRCKPSGSNNNNANRCMVLPVPSSLRTDFSETLRTELAATENNTMMSEAERDAERILMSAVGPIPGPDDGMTSPPPPHPSTRNRSFTNRRAFASSNSGGFSTSRDIGASMLSVLTSNGSALHDMPLESCDRQFNFPSFAHSSVARHDDSVVTVTERQSLLARQFAERYKLLGDNNNNNAEGYNGDDNDEDNDNRAEEGMARTKRPSIRTAAMGTSPASLQHIPLYFSPLQTNLESDNTFDGVAGGGSEDEHAPPSALLSETKILSSRHNNSFKRAMLLPCALSSRATQQQQQQTSSNHPALTLAVPPPPHSTALMNPESVSPMQPSLAMFTERPSSNASPSGTTTTANGQSLLRFPLSKSASEYGPTSNNNNNNNNNNRSGVVTFQVAPNGTDHPSSHHGNRSASEAHVLPQLSSAAVAIVNCDSLLHSAQRLPGGGASGGDAAAFMMFSSTSPLRSLYSTSSQQRAYQRMEELQSNFNESRIGNNSEDSWI